MQSLLGGRSFNECTDKYSRTSTIQFHYLYWATQVLRLLQDHRPHSRSPKSRVRTQRRRSRSCQGYGSSVSKGVEELHTVSTHFKIVYRRTDCLAIRTVRCGSTRVSVLRAIDNALGDSLNHSLTRHNLGDPLTRRH
jgi:hypothetical protein